MPHEIDLAEHLLLSEKKREVMLPRQRHALFQTSALKSTNSLDQARLHLLQKKELNKKNLQSHECRSVDFCGFIMAIPPQAMKALMWKV